MSASLVGSEMCIRDRSTDWPYVGAGRVVWSLSRCGAHALLAERATGTVSYTHLTLPTICSV
eukprot:5819142-Alexandrium_andersonii.AAC.1